ncbi:D-2-hydroxyacid dehydrogenase [Salisediminibacterium beveridgei]|uniref:D-3-phosphoglycerate dehydrogenase n=1 Tax=Salisediminibacterium beveridgei TaxID=632773 RepID=A0A1D7QXF5_9BACI|nr:D-2-hydroxyacid dehydrogenase [Salisediminibacterium beveridgei]AOM83628.1 D-3-phosphoglycerate dehydrogenase [Salisediminibacterium beveridgei]
MMIVSTIHMRKDIRERLTETYPDHEFRFHKQIESAEEDLPKADIILTYGMDLEARHIESAKRLKWINVMSSGVDKLPMDVIKNRDILITNARGIHAIQMAEYTIAMMLQAARQTKTLIHQEREREWFRKLPIRELYGHQVGILGTGAIGSEIAKRTDAFGMTTTGFNRSGKKPDHFDAVHTIDQLPERISELDYLVAVLPRTEETDQLLNEALFSKMKASAVLINIGRGNVIHEEDLLKALQSNALDHAILDVFNEEPLPKDHPFWFDKNITVTPHMAGLSPEYQPRAVDQFDYNMKKFVHGDTDFLNQIDTERGY